MKFKHRNIFLAVFSVFAISGCVTTGPHGGIKPSSVSVAGNDPCASNGNRNGGALIGAILGGVVAHHLGNQDPMTTAGGAIAGGLLGGWIGAELDRRACALATIQKKHDMEMTISRIKVDEVPGKAGTGQAEGLSVTVVDRANRPQFERGSDRLTPEAEAQYRDIAIQYLPQKNAGKDEIDAAKSRRVMLVGHTDDEGATKQNAELSERRAKAVAKVFKDVGVPESQIYFQGAGEAYPIASNETAAGRAKNRRVEIVDVSSDAGFDSYLTKRKPDTKLYRKTIVASSAKTSKVKPLFDFGGQPLASGSGAPNIGALNNDLGFSIIKTAHAGSDMVHSCTEDRPRAIGEVKSLSGSVTYAGADMAPGAYDTSWAGMANGNLVSLTHVAVTRKDGTLIRKPELRIYRNFTGDAKAKADLIGFPEVNVYRGDQAMLYRVFGTKGVRCVDLVIPNRAPMTAPSSAIVYDRGNQVYYAAAAFNNTRGK